MYQQQAPQNWPYSRELAETLTPLDGFHLLIDFCTKVMENGQGDQILHTDIRHMNSHLESHNQQFNEASSMVLAASDLLHSASNTDNVQLSALLDNNTLRHLAEAIYREVQVVEILYIQLCEMLEQVRGEQVTPYNLYPQVAVPLTKLNHPQLQDLLEAGKIKLESLESSTGATVDIAHQGAINHLRQSINDLQSEISTREKKP